MRFYRRGGAVIEKIIDRLPDIAKSVSSPLQKTEKMVFLGSAGRTVGPSQFAKEMNRLVAEVPETVKAITGIDLIEAMQNFGLSKPPPTFAHDVSEGVAEKYDHMMNGHQPIYRCSDEENAFTR